MPRSGISTKHARKVPSGPKFWNPRKYPENPKKYQNGHFWYFRGGFFFFLYFSWEFQVEPCQGSVAGRGVLNTRPSRLTRQVMENVKPWKIMQEQTFLREACMIRSSQAGGHDNFTCADASPGLSWRLSRDKREDRCDRERLSLSLSQNGFCDPVLVFA